MAPFRRKIAYLLLFLFLAGCGALPRQEEPQGFAVAYVAEEGLSLFREEDGKTLLLPGKHFNAPRFTPDGAYVIFNESSDLFCLSLAQGTRALVAANAVFVAFDETGRIISFSETSGAAAYDPLASTSETLLAPPEGMVLAAFLPSPDFTRFAYVLAKQDAGLQIPQGLFVTIPGASEVLTFSAGEISGREMFLPLPLSWATDGSALLVAAGQAEAASLYVVPVVDGSPYPVSRKEDMLAPFPQENLAFGGGQALLPVRRNKDDWFLSLVQIDLFSFSYTHLQTAGEDFSGVSLAYDGSMAAYTAEGAGLYTFWAGKTAKIADGAKLFAPQFATDRQSIFFLQEQDDNLAFCRAPANSAGLSILFEGIANPNVAIGQTHRQRFAVFEPASPLS